MGEEKLSIRPHNREAKQAMNEQTATGHTLSSSLSFSKLLKFADSTTEPYCVLLDSIVRVEMEVERDKDVDMNRPLAVTHNIA